MQDELDVPAQGRPVLDEPGIVRIRGQGWPAVCRRLGQKD
jgi:hypothetical protein